MTEINKKKKFFIIPITIILFILFIYLYNESNKSVVPTTEIHNIKIHPSDNLTKMTKITGSVSLSNFETIAFSTPTRVNNIIYITTYSKKSILKEKNFELTLRHVNDIQSVEKIILIGGDFYSGSGIEKGISEEDYKSIKDSKVIWEK